MYFSDYSSDYESEGNISDSSGKYVLNTEIDYFDLVNSFKWKLDPILEQYGYKVNRHFFVNFVEFLENNSNYTEDLEDYLLEPMIYNSLIMLENVVNKSVNSIKFRRKLYDSITFM